LPWPAYSPDCNPIEHAWDAIDGAVRSRDVQPSKLDELATALQEEWRNIGQRSINKHQENMLAMATGLFVVAGESSTLGDVAERYHAEAEYFFMLSTELSEVATSNHQSLMNLPQHYRKNGVILVSGALTSWLKVCLDVFKIQENNKSNIFITFYQFYWYNNMAKSHQYWVYPPRLSITAYIRLGLQQKAIFAQIMS
jgi:hypothetical protein